MRIALVLAFLAPLAAAQEELRDAERYVAALDSANPFVSFDALEYLVGYYGERALPVVQAGLRAKSPNIRGRCAEFLQRVPCVSAVPRLIELLEDPAAMELNTLSDDGRSMGPTYGAELEGAVARRALYALWRITGWRLGALGAPGSAQSRALAERYRARFESEPLLAPVPAPSYERLASRSGEPFEVPSYARFLAGVKICLDPGHGGQAARRGFKRGPSNLREAEINLRVARYLRRFLARVGAAVILTRDSDRDLPLRERAQIAVRAGCDLFVSCHHNWTQRYWESRTSVWYHLTPGDSPAGCDLARYLQRGLDEHFPMEFHHGTRGLMSDALMYKSGFGVLRNLAGQVPGALCESTYYSNWRTEQRLRDPLTLECEAYGMFIGLARYLWNGIPHAEIASCRRLDEQRVEIRLRLFDGLEDRGEWISSRTQLFPDSTRILLDGEPLACMLEKGGAEAVLTAPLAAGSHRLDVHLLNVNGNHSWPKPLELRIP